MCVCEYVQVFLAGIAYGSVYFLSLSRKLDTPPRLNCSSTFVFSDSGGRTLPPPFQPALGKISGFNFRVCVYIYASVCGSESERDHMCTV